ARQLFQGAIGIDGLDFATKGPVEFAIADYIVHHQRSAVIEIFSQALSRGFAELKISLAAHENDGEAEDVFLVRINGDALELNVKRGRLIDRLEQVRHTMRRRIPIAVV